MLIGKYIEMEFILMKSFSVWESFSTIVPILITIGIGYVMGRFKILRESFANEANRLNFTIGFPLLLFCSTVTADIKALFEWKLVLYSISSILIMAFAAYYIFGKFTDKKKQGALTTTTFRSDILLFAVYISGKLFGNEGVALAAMLTAFISPTVTLLSILILNRLDEEHGEELNLRYIILNVFKNPFFIAVIFGILYNASGLWFPPVIHEPLSNIGSIAIPLSLLAIGVQLDFKNVLENSRLVTAGVLSRLVIVPLIFMTGAVLLGFTGNTLACLFAQYAAPATVSCYTFAEQMNSDARLAGNIVVFSTVFSIPTIFIGLLIFTNMGLI